MSENQRLSCEAQVAVNFSPGVVKGSGCENHFAERLVKPLNLLVCIGGTFIEVPASVRLEGWEMTDKKGTKILARTFFNQLRASGFTQNQIIDLAGELIDLVASDIRDQDKEDTGATEEARHSA